MNIYAHMGTTDKYLEVFMKLSLIIPCYNEEDALPYIYEELVKVSATLSDYEIEYLFVAPKTIP